jgi:hypothetical protein
LLPAHDTTAHRSLTSAQSIQLLAVTLVERYCTREWRIRRWNLGHFGITFSIEEFAAESTSRISFSNINIRDRLVLTSSPNTAEISLAHTIHFMLGCDELEDLCSATVGVNSFDL